MAALSAVIRAEAVSLASASAGSDRSMDKFAGSPADEEACCTTCVNSCASRARPDVVPGGYCPAPNTTSLPTVYASASTAFADVAALSSVCTFTRLRSWPNLGSKKLRVTLSRGCPGERSTSCTIGGATPVSTGPEAFRCSVFFSLHSSHSPPEPPDPPHAHLFCKAVPTLTLENDQSGFAVPAAMTSSAIRSASCSKASLGSPILKPLDALLEAALALAEGASSLFFESNARLMASNPSQWRGPRYRQISDLLQVRARAALVPAAKLACDADGPTPLESDDQPVLGTIHFGVPPRGLCGRPVRILATQAGRWLA